MNFNLDVWKEQAGQKLQQVGGWLKHRRDKELPYVVYGALSTMAVWPLVQAAQGGQLLPVVMALGGVAGGVGGNLLADQIQRWTDRAGSLTEEAVADWVSEALPASPELRQALDEILTALEAVPQAQAALADDDRAWFERALQAELETLESAVHLEATLIGDGTIVQGDGAVGAGAGGVAVGGDVHGDVLMPGATKSADPQQAKLAGLQRTYLERLAHQCNALPLSALGGDKEAEDEITLEAIYIALDTTTRVPLSEAERSKTNPDLRGQEDRALPAMEATAQEKRLVLVGDPGSGKSTFVRQLAGRLALARLGQQSLPADWDGAVWPMLTTLRAQAPRLAENDLTGLSARERDRRLVAVVHAQWRADLENLRLGELAARLDDILANEPLLIILDGLDEVPEGTRRRVRQAVGAALKTYPNIERIIVTCRVRSYTGAAVLAGFAKHELAPFDRQKIGRFAGNWYGAQRDRLGQAAATDKAQDLGQVVLGEDLRELAQNPMLLTTMAIIHQQEIGLPKERVRLFDLACQVLLRKWQREKGLAVSAALEAVLNDDIKLQAIMRRLAYEIHRRQAQGDMGAALDRGKIITLLEDPKYLGDIGLAGEFLDYVDQRAGLLVGRGGVEDQKPQTYDFPHRTFQEYLAGCQMVDGRGSTINREYRERVAEGDYWYLAGQLGGEHLYYNRESPLALLDLAYSLCPVRKPAGARQWRAALWSGQMAVVLGAQLIEDDDESEDDGPHYLARLIDRLAQVLTGNRLSPYERAEAGRVLARLGDPRPEAGTVRLAGVDHSPVLAMQFCYVPAGPFWMGSPDDDELADENEKPLHQVDIPYAYWLSRYPVTVAQFGAFVAAGGYGEATYWAEARAQGYWEDGKVRRRTVVEESGDFKVVDEFANAPYDYGYPFNLPNHPVVGVNWYEALAFCHWLTEILRGRGSLSETWRAMLPGESEWEKGARGGVMIPDKPVIVAPNEADFSPPPDATLIEQQENRRRYPWGAEVAPERLNYEATGLNTTSAVGCFSGGASPYGCEEMAGNVWEWTRSLWGEDSQKPDFGYPYTPKDGREDQSTSYRVLRVLRGGAYYSDASRVRCGARLGNLPRSRLDGRGFRVALSPLPLASDPSGL